MILLDILLPDSDGYEICESLKSNLKNVPIFYITAVPESEVKKNIKNVGILSGAILLFIAALLEYYRSSPKRKNRKEKILNEK